MDFFNPILPTLYNSCFTCDGFPFAFYYRYGNLTYTRVLFQMGEGLYCKVSLDSVRAL
jgi:hypothetical protein